jgi:hypothetical protein
MESTCYYCKKQATVRDMTNPNTKEIHPTCQECEGHLFINRKQLMGWGKLGCIGSPLLILLSNLSFIFINWVVGVVLIICSILLFIVSNAVHKHYANKKDIEIDKIKNA